MSPMQYVKLGASGAAVSALGLGCLSFGDPDRGSHSWTLREDAASAVIRAALEAGINFFDTANVYSAGDSERILGTVLNRHARREEVVVATKVHGQMAPGPNGWGLSRKHIRWQVEQSLKRLGTDYIDLYQVHRWDDTTPLEETLEALDSLVRDGLVLYLGASSMHAWQFGKALCLQRRYGWAPFVTMQDHYNLIYREEEREMFPLLADAGVGALPYCTLACGRLARDPDAETPRRRRDERAEMLYRQAGAADRRICAAVAEVAAELGASRAQVALAWVLANPLVTAPLIGVTSVAQLTEDLGALDLVLDDDQLRRLGEGYVPHAVVGL